MDDLFKPLEALSLNNVELTGKEIGRGAYGVVLEVKVSGLSCAGKKLHDVIAEEFLVKNFVQECVNHSQLRHPNIVQLMGVYFSPDSTIPILVMERLQVSLAQCLNDSILPLKLKYDILLDVANGLNYLHNRTPPIIHRDLTAQNILLTKSFSAKISDLGVSKIIDYTKPRSHTYVPGNPVAMPPEAYLSDTTYDFKLDVFSYGCLILHIFNQDLPVPVNQLPSDPLTEWQRRFSHVARMGRYHPLLPIAKDCLENDPAMRPNMSYIIRVIKASAYTSPDDTSTVNYLDHTYERILNKLEEQNLGGQESYRYKNYDDDFADVTTLNRSTDERHSFSCEDIKDAISSEIKDSRGKKIIEFNKWNFSLQEPAPGSVPISRKKFAKKTPAAQEKRPQSTMASFTVEKKLPSLPPRVLQNHGSKFTRPSSPLISNHWAQDSCSSPTTHSSCLEVHTPPSPKKFTLSPVMSKKSLAQSMGQPEPTSVYSPQSQCSPTLIHMHKDPNIGSQCHASECPNVSYRERSQHVSGISTYQENSLTHESSVSNFTTLPQKPQSVEDDPPMIHRSSPVITSRSQFQSSRSIHNGHVSSVASTNNDCSPVLHCNSPILSPFSSQLLSYDSEPNSPIATPPIIQTDSECSMSPSSSPILPSKLTFSLEEGSLPRSSNSRKMKYKREDEQQHELMFNFDEDTSHTRSRDPAKVLPSLNKSEVTTQSQNLHDSHEVTPAMYPFHPNSPRLTTRQSNPHEWYHHKISNATAEVILLERERKNGNFIVHSNSNGEYYLLVCFQEKAIHMRIYKDKNKKFFLDGLCCNNKKSFDGLDELVNYYREIPLVIEDKLIILKLLSDL